MGATRPEPNSMTLGDAVALVAGVGLAFAIAGRPTGEPFHFSPDGPYLFEIALFSQGSSLALACVVLTRVSLHRRSPTAVEWLGMLVGGLLLLNLPWLEADGWFEPIRESFPMAYDRLYASGLRWAICGLFSAPIVVGLALLRLGRQIVPSWMKAVLLAGLAVLAMAGPFSAFEFEGAKRLAPRGNVGPDVGSRLTWKAVVLAVRLPSGILFGVPAVVALGDRLRRCRWTWAEWASAGMASLACLTWVASFRPDFSIFTIPWLLGWGLVLGWLAAVVLLSRLIAAKLGGRWQRWIGLATDQGRPSLSLNSEAITH